METNTIQDIRELFPALNRVVYDKPLIYLDNAATTLKPSNVIHAVAQYYSQYPSNVRRGTHRLNQEASEQYERTREKTRAFLNAKKTAEIIFTKGATDAINCVAQSWGRAFLKNKDEIIVSQMEHHSNFLPWKQIAEETGCALKTLPVNKQGELSLEEFKNLFSDSVKLVAVTLTSNVLGTVNPVKDMARLAHEAGAKILIDAAQAVGSQSIDVREMDCDFLCFSGHKMYGPTGVGVLYAKEDILKKMPPYQSGGEMIKDALENVPEDLPYRFEAGTPNIAGVIGLGAALDFLKETEIDKIRDHKKSLVAYTLNKLKEVDSLTVLGCPQNRDGIVSFTFKEAHPHDAATILDQNGIAVRSGHLCAQPLLKALGISSALRISFGVYNTKEEIDKTAAVLKQIQKLFA